MSKLGLSSQILKNTPQYTGKPICVTSFSRIPHAFLPCGAEKNRTWFDSLHARQITRAGSACMEMIHGFKEGWIIWHPRGLNLTNGNGPLWWHPTEKINTGEIVIIICDFNFSDFITKIEKVKISKIKSKRFFTNYFSLNTRSRPFSNSSH